MDRQADPVADPVEEELAVPGVDDDLPGCPVHVLSRCAGLHGGFSRCLGLPDDLVHLLLLLRGGAGKEGPGSVGAVGLVPSAEVEDDHVVFFDDPPVAAVVWHGSVGAAGHDGGEGNLVGARFLEELRNLFGDLPFRHARPDEIQQLAHNGINNAGRLPHDGQFILVLPGAERVEDACPVAHPEIHGVPYGEHVHCPDAVVEGDLSPDDAQVFAAPPEGARESLVVVPFGVEGDVSEGVDHLLLIQQGRHGETPSVLRHHEPPDPFVGVGVQPADVLQVRGRAEVHGVELQFLQFFCKRFQSLPIDHGYPPEVVLPAESRFPACGAEFPERDDLPPSGFFLSP